MSEQLARRIRTALGEFNDDDQPVTGLVLNVVRRLTTLRAEKEALETECGELKASEVFHRNQAHNIQEEYAKLQARCFDSIPGMSVFDALEAAKAEKETLEGELGRLRPVFDAAIHAYIMGDTDRLYELITDTVDIETYMSGQPTQEPTNGS